MIPVQGSLSKVHGGWIVDNARIPAVDEVVGLSARLRNLGGGREGWGQSSV